MVQLKPMSPTWPDESNEAMYSTSSSVLVGPAAEPPVLIAVMGQTGVGKSTFINTASGSNLAIGKGLDSCTSSVQGSEPFELDGRRVTLLDTPGFDDSALSDVDVLKLIAMSLGTSYMEGVLFTGMIYVHRISDIRMTGTAKRNFTMFRELCGENAMRNVVIVTTMWGKVGKEEGEARERELQNKDGFFKDALEMGAKMVRHESEDLNSALEILRLIIGNNPLPLLIQRELVDQEKLLVETSAGKEVNRELYKKIEKHEKEMEILRQELQEARDAELETELEQELEKHRMEMRKVQAEMGKLKHDNLEWGLKEVVAAGGLVAGGFTVGLVSGQIALALAVGGLAVGGLAVVLKQEMAEQSRNANGDRVERVAHRIEW